MKQPQLERREVQQTVPERPKCEDIGPTTKEGIPIVLRSVCNQLVLTFTIHSLSTISKQEVDEDLHHKWYKRMYNTLHKVHQDGKLYFSICNLNHIVQILSF